MNRRHYLVAASALLLSAACYAQTGILDASAEYRKFPLEAMKLMKDRPADKMPVLPELPKTEPGRPQRYHPIDSDNLKINPILDSINRAHTDRPIAGSHRKGDNPVLFLIGDSTMRTEVAGNGDNGQWGWGYFIENWFDTDKITVENHGLGGESTRSFYRSLLFPLLQGVRPGDWVIIQMGHNDRTSGEWNDGRFRGLLPGAGKETKEVIVPIQTREMVYTYGEYLRRYIKEIRLRGANPLLLSPTSRSGRNPEGKIPYDNKAEVIKAVAEEMNVPFIDFNKLIVDKYNNVFDSRKVDYMFFSDGIHTSKFGAVVNASTFADELRKRTDIGLSQYLRPEIKHESAVREPGKPVLFVCGDSTGNIDNSAESGMVGWGQVAQQYFNEKKIKVDNHAKAGRSARTFLDEGRWNNVYEALQPGDWVIIQFGHNDGGPINTGKARGELPGNDNEKQVMTMEATGVNQGIYSYGWYIRKFCLDAMEKGATPVVLSLTPGNWRTEDGKMVRESKYKAWAKEAAEQVGAYFVDLNEISASKLDKLSLEETAKHYAKDGVHSTELGANRNAKSVAEGIKKLKKCPLSKMVK